MKRCDRFSLVSLGVGLLLDGGCSTVLCDHASYAGGLEVCEIPSDAIHVSTSVDRTDLRGTTPLSIRIEARTAVDTESRKLAEAPQVRLSMDGRPPVAALGTLSADDRYAVKVDLAQLQLGSLSAEIELSGLPPVRTDGRHRVYRSPHFGPAAVLSLPWNTHRMVPVSGRVSVQVASPEATPGQVLITEQFEFLGKTRRWMELYAQGASGLLGYVGSPGSAWDQTQMKLNEDATALLAYSKGAVLIYAPTLTPGTQDLSLVQLGGLTQTGLSAVEPRIPKNATALSASAEEAIFLLYQGTEVRAFETNLRPGANAVKHIGTVAVSGNSVMAARDILGSVPSERSSAFLGVVWEPTGALTLLRLRSLGASSGIETVSVGTAVAPLNVTGLALADLDVDGLQDLVFAKSATGELYYSPQHPDGSFREQVALGVSVPNSTSISVGDMNLDGLPDVAVATKEKSITIFYNQK